MTESRFTYRVDSKLRGLLVMRYEDGVFVGKSGYHFSAIDAVAAAEGWVEEQEAAYALTRLRHPAGKGRHRLTEPASA